MTPDSVPSRFVPSYLIALALVLMVAGCTAIGQGHRSHRAKSFFTANYLLMAQAIERNDMARLKHLAQGQDLGRKGEKDMDLLWFAFMRENFDAIQVLLELGVNPDEQRAKGIGSALQATFMKHEDTRYLKAMLDAGLSPNHQHPDYGPMLHRGVFGGLEHVKLLLRYGCDLNTRNGIGSTALHAAISRRKPEIAIYLLQQGVDFNTYTVNGVSPAWATHIAIDSTRPGNPVHEKFLELRELLIAKGAKWPPDDPPAVRDQMRARGETPVVPYGHTR